MTQAPTWYRRITKVSWVGRLAESIPGKRWVGRAFLGLGDVEAVTLTPEQRQAAWAELADEMKQLQDRYGIDTTRWRPSES